MVETTRRSPESARIERFDRGERVLHWANATLFLILIATAAALYVAPISVAVGRRELVKHIHVIAGLCLPVPLVGTFISGEWGRAFRADVRRLNRFSPSDWRWLRSIGRDPWARPGKFNAGQKLNAAFTAGAVWVMLGTGSIMRWPRFFPLSWRTGATFVHDWVFCFLVLTITGHIVMAVRDRDGRGAIVRGWVTTTWAKRHTPGWHDEIVGPPRP